MAVGTVTRIDNGSDGSNVPLKWDEITVVGEASYAAGGSEGLQAALEQEVKDKREIVAIVPQDSQGFQLEYERGADQLRVFRFDALGGEGEATEVTATTNLSAFTFRLSIISR